MFLPRKLKEQNFRAFWLSAPSPALPQQPSEYSSR